MRPPSPLLSIANKYLLCDMQNSSDEWGLRLKGLEVPGLGRWGWAPELCYDFEHAAYLPKS